MLLKTRSCQILVWNLSLYRRTFNKVFAQLDLKYVHTDIIIVNCICSISQVSTSVNTTFHTEGFDNKRNNLCQFFGYVNMGGEKT